MRHIPEQQRPTGLQLTPMDSRFRECPHIYLDQLRTADPVHTDHELGRFFLTRAADVRAVLSNRALSCDPRKAAPGSYDRRAVIGDTPIEMVELSMIHLDNPDHRRIRSLVAQAFNQRASDAARPRIRAIAHRLLQRLSGRDEFDVIADYAALLPIIVIAEMLGIKATDLAQVKRWSDAHAQVLNPERTAEQTADLVAAEVQLNEFFLRIVAARRHRPGPDLVSGLLAAAERGDGLSEREIAINCRLLLVAGTMTTTDLIGNGVLALLRYPPELAKLRARPELLPNAIEEILRYDPPLAQISRVAIESLAIGGVSVQPGQAITPSLLAAGHDPAIHIEPHRFDVEREDTTHFAFGGGAHFCLGAPLARTEAQIAIALVFERFPGLRLDPEYAVERRRVPVFNGVEALRVVLEGSESDA